MINLTEVNNSYVHSLNQNMNKILSSYSDEHVNLFEFKSLVRQIVIDTNDKPIEQKSNSTKRFLTSLDRQKSKTEVLSLVYNSQLSGDNLKVIK